MLANLPLLISVGGGLVVLAILFFLVRLVLSQGDNPSSRIDKLLGQRKIMEASRLLVEAGRDGEAIDLLIGERRLAEAARVYLRIGNHERAAELFTKIGDHEAAANSYRKVGRIVDAAKALEQIHGYEESGDLYVQAKDYKQAARMYNKGKQYKKAGDLLLRLGDKKRAAALLAKHYTQIGDLDKAGKHFLLSGKLKQAGETFYKAGEFDKAAQIFEKLGEFRLAAKARLQAGETLAAAEALEKVGDLAAAIRLYEAADEWNKVVELYKRQRNWAALGNIMMRLEKYDLAVEFFKRITPLEEDYMESAMSLASILEGQGDIKESIKKYTEILNFRGVNVQTSKALFAMATLCERTNRADQALPMLRQFDAVGPVAEKAKNWLERLENMVISGAQTMAVNIETMSEEEARQGKVEFELPKRDSIAERYDVVDKIGQGGHGVIYKAFDKTLGRHVVLKFLFRNQVPDDVAKRYFLREAMTTAVLNHPNIVTLYDMGQVGENLYLSMEFIDGITLEDKIRDHSGVLPLDYVASVTYQLCDALQYAHDKSIIHRDIKPGNVMLTGMRKDNVKLMDFGLAKALDENPSKTLIICGTPLYMSPEQIVGDFVDHLSDIYSLGILIFQLLTGKTPFPSANILAHHQFTPAPHPTTLRKEIPVEAGDIVLKALEKARENRYQKASEFAVDLGAALGFPLDE
ncbi:MAG: protein kinase [Pseudomonadota bacterium]